MNPFYKTTEEHPENENAAAGVLYFEGNPSDDDIDAAVIKAYGEECGSGAVDDGGAGWERKETPVSKRAKLVRVVVFDGAA